VQHPDFRVTSKQWPRIVNLDGSLQFSMQGSWSRNMASSVSVTASIQNRLRSAMLNLGEVPRSREQNQSLKNQILE